MSEMKSAREIALEKIDKLGKASPDELRQQRVEKYSQIGRSLADKLLLNLDFRHCELELQKYPAGDRDLLSQTLLESLVQAIELEDGERAQRALMCIARLKGESTGIEAIEEKIIKLLGEYDQAREALTGELEQPMRDALKKLGISGSAVGGINALADAEAQKRLKEMASPYREELNKLGQELLV